MVQKRINGVSDGATEGSVLPFLSIGGESIGNTQKRLLFHRYFLYREFAVGRSSLSGCRDLQASGLVGIPAHSHDLIKQPRSTTHGNDAAIVGKETEFVPRPALFRLAHTYFFRGIIQPRKRSVLFELDALLDIFQSRYSITLPKEGKRGI